MNISSIKRVVLPLADLYTLNYFVASSQEEYHTFLPKKDTIIRLLEQTAPNLRYLACIAGNYLRYYSLEQYYQHSRNIL